MADWSILATLDDAELCLHRTDLYGRVILIATAYMFFAGRALRAEEDRKTNSRSLLTKEC